MRGTRSNRNNEHQQLTYQFGKPKKRRTASKETMDNAEFQSKQQFHQFPLLQKRQQPQLISEQQFETQFQHPRQKRKFNSRTSQRNKRIQAAQLQIQPIKLNFHHQNILKILELLISNPIFQKIDEAKLRPTANSQIRQMKQKLKGSYQIFQFQNDISKIFNVFYAQSSDESNIIQQVKKLQDSVNLQINKFKNNLEQIVGSQSANSKSIRKSSCQQSSPKKEQIQLSNGFKNKNPKKIFPSEPCKGQQSRRRGRQSTVIPPRSKHLRITIKEIASLGFNIHKLSSQDLEQICHKFCSEKNEKVESHAIFYSFDLQKIPKQLFCQLQAHVKMLFKSRNQPYQQVRLQQDQDFVIEADD